MDLKEAMADNCWLFEEGQFVTYKDAPYRPDKGYDITLPALTTSAQVLDAIAQVNTKTWATPKVVGDLVRLLDALLHFQGNYCGSGFEHGPVDVAAHLNRRAT